jgi:Flp pilus assembly protein TadG
MRRTPGDLMMLNFKNRENKLKKLQEARRAYVEQLAFIRQFKKDEDGGLIVLTLILLISMLVVGGMAVDFMRFESERTKLQSVSDRAVLAAANLNDDRDPGAIITDFFVAEGYGGTIIGEPDIDKNANGSTITLNSQIDMDTFFLRFVGMDTLSAPASASAIQGTGNVEVSLILDISGSMGNWMQGPITQYDANGNIRRDADGEIITVTGWGTRMFFLQQAAKQFVSDLLLPEYEDRISINLIAYSQHVRLRDDLYMALRTTPDGINESDEVGSSFGGIEDGYAVQPEYQWVLNGETEDEFGNPYGPDTEGATLQQPWEDGVINVDWADGEDYFINPSRCVTFEDAEYETLTFDINRTYQQVEHVDFYGGSNNNYFGWEPCSADPEHGIILMSQDVEELHDAIDAFYPTVNTSIHRGMKWGVSLLDPSMRPLIDRIQTVDEAFRGIRPAEYTDTTTSKFIVIMTDGLTVSSSRIRREGYGDDVDFYDEYDERVAFSESSGSYVARYDGDWRTQWTYDVSPYTAMSQSIGSTTQLNNKLESLCDLARGQVREVFTISMGVQNDTMRDCASRTENAFMTTITNDPDEPGLNDIFETIADQITALRLSL